MSSLKANVDPPKHYANGVHTAGDCTESTPLAAAHSQGLRTDQLLLRMNHEVRTAVNAILGVSELLLESRMTRQQGYHINILRMSAEHLLTQSSEIVDVARAELGSLRLQATSFNLRKTLQQTIELLAILAAQKGHTLQSEISDSVPPAAIGDPARVSEVLISVVRAAFCRVEGAEILIKIDADRCDPDGVGLECRIADKSGNLASGLVADDFLDPNPDHRERASLALTLAGHLARMMGGELWIDDPEESGALFRFRVVLAAVSQPESDGAETRPLASADSPRLRILVAEDGPPNQLLIRAFLKDEPWVVDLAPDGLVALEKATAGSYDLILMDLDMPEMDGYTATREIRIWECANQVSAVPIVALTAYSEAEAVVKSFEAGCTAHVTKPFTKAGLLQAIRLHAAAR